jgi:hypothetical protein
MTAKFNQGGSGPVCLRYGWKALCNRFRKYLNDKSGPKPDDSGERLRWIDRRAKLADEFFKAEEIDPASHLAHEVCHHTPVIQERGRRRCLRCLEQHVVEKALKGK